MSILPQAIYRINTIPIKIPMAFFLKIEKITNPEIHTAPQKRQNRESNYKNEQSRCITLPNFKLLYITVV